MYLNILYYTHSDMGDVWKASLQNLFKYFINKFDEDKINLYLALNGTTTHFYNCEKRNLIYYDDSKPYTTRLHNVLNQLPLGMDSAVLFLHEDMILYDYADTNYIQECIRAVTSKTFNSIKLIRHDGYVYGKLNHCPKIFERCTPSIQPTIFNSTYLKELISNNLDLSIWDFENKLFSTFYHDNDVLINFGNEKKRGISHYDSPVFPYIATAINKGKWNLSEYPVELNFLFKKYSIDPTVRGCV